MTPALTPTWKGRLIALGVGVLLCLVVFEGGARLLESQTRGNKGAATIPLTMQPYMMFVGHPGDNPTWRNIQTHADIPSKMTFNNLGFVIQSDLSVPLEEAFIEKYRAKAGERLILLTGGSVAYGLGATTNDRTISAQLESVLNERQSRYKYRVINFAMGSWIAYQQFTALSLFGPPLAPDWIVTLDGHNDGAVGCAQGSGVANPLGWPNVLRLTADQNPTRSSGPLRWLIANLAAVRVVTGLTPAEPDRQLDQIYFAEDDSEKGYRMRGLTFGDVDKQVTFYLLAQQNLKNMLGATNILFTSQPLLHNNAISPWYRKAFRPQDTALAAVEAKSHLKADLDSYMAKSATTKCVSSASSRTLGYFMGRSALRLEQEVATWSTTAEKRHLVYANVEMAFPGGYGARLPYFIDNAHLSDLGQRKTAEYLAGYILQSDLMMPFDPAQFAATVSAEANRLRGAVESEYTLPPDPPSKPAEGNRSLEGVNVATRSPGVLLITERADDGYHRVIWAGAPSTPVKENVLSFAARSTAIPMIRVELLDKSGAYGRADFDLFAGNVVASNGNKVAAQIADLGKGWKRVTLTVPLVENSAMFNITLMSADDELKYPGSNKSVAVTEPTLSAK